MTFHFFFIFQMFDEILYQCDKQTTLILFSYYQVKAVSSLTITCQSPVRANADKMQSFPLGMNVLFSVTLHDNIGRAFSVATIPLKYRLNR